MTIKTDVNADSRSWQHNETLAVRTDIKAGLPCRYCNMNHNETLVVRGDVKAAGLHWNHNESFLC